MRILLDTNIIVSGLLSANQPPGELLASWLDGGFELVTSNAQIEELRRVVGYDKLRTRISPQQAANVLENLDTMSVVVELAAGIDLSLDPDDNVILGTAIAGDAKLIVSGDKAHMLSLEKVNGIPIMTAREAVRWLRAQGVS